MAQKNKCTITEERLTRLVSESIEEVLLEAQNDEGLGGWLGKMAGKIRNGVNNEEYNIIYRCKILFQSIFRN